MKKTPVPHDRPQVGQTYRGKGENGKTYFFRVTGDRHPGASGYTLQA